MRTCTERHCDEPAVAYVRYQVWDDDNTWSSIEDDLCADHFQEVMDDDDHVYLAVNEVIEYTNYGYSIKETAA